jgi:flagellar motor switch protein FliN
MMDAVPMLTETFEPAGTKPAEPWLDLELEVRLHFGGREMSLAEALEIAPGTILELDRDVTDPVDLLVGDRIVARGEVVVIGGSFALQVSEVLEPQPRLESVRCLL